MVNQFAAPPINPVISIQPLTTPAATRDSGSVPTQLANAVPGTTVQGFVINRDAQNNPILRTPIGDILIKSDVFIKTGSEVLFRVDPSQPSFARILTIDGMEPQDYVAQSAHGLKRDTIIPGAARGAQASLQALLLSNTPPTANAIASNPLLASIATASAPVSAAIAKLQLGTALKVTLLQAQLPEQIAAPQQAAVQAPAKPQTAPATATPNTSAPLTTKPGQPAPLQQTTQAAPMANAATARAAMQPTAIPMPEYVPSTPSVQLTAQARADTLLPLPGEPPRKTESRPDQPARSPTAQPAAQTAPAPKQGVPVVVIGHEKDGALVLQGSFGTLKSYMPQPFPVGTKLTIALEPAARPSAQPIGTTPLTGDMEQITTLARDWDSLDHALRWAQTSEPAVAREIMQQIPNIGHKLTSGLLFFIAAVKGGDLRQLLGARALQTLELKAPEIAARMKQDMAQLQQFLTDSPLTNWSSVMVPMLYNNQLEHARLFFRHDQEQEGAKGGKGADQRFILEVDLSQMGDMQFDGFVRNVKQSGKQFDLIIRSLAPLEPNISEEIRQIFENALKITGYKGYLGFQHGTEHFVRPLADTQGSGGSQSNTILA